MRVQMAGVWASSFWLGHGVGKEGTPAAFSPHRWVRLSM